MITIAGGEILSQKGTTITYKLKCDVCGRVEESDSTVTMLKGVTEVTTRTCSFCGNPKIIKIKIELN